MKSSPIQLTKGNLRTFIATGGVLAGAGTASQAAIVYTDISDLTVSSGSSIYFSLTDQTASTSGAAVDEEFELYFFPNATSPNIGSGNSHSSLNAVNSGNYYTPKLSAGVTIGSGLTFATFGYIAKNGSGSWSPGDRAFLGLQVNVGGVKYGWADVEYTAGQQLRLYSFAYDNSGAGIQAGATVVPEPATTGAIAALFAGSVAAFELRRRRKSVSRTSARPREISQERA